MNTQSIDYFPIADNALCLPPPPQKKNICINYCCEILLGGLHIPNREGVVRNNTTVLDYDENWNLLLYKEAFHIKRQSPSLNNYGLKSRGGGVLDPCLGIGVPPRVWNPDPV